MNMKKMTQKEFDDYVATILIPEIQDEHGKELVILLTESGCIKFAKECESCHDYVVINGTYDIPKEMRTIVQDSEIISYLEVLTGLDVYELNEINECECFDDEVDIEEDEDYYEESYEDDLLPEDAYDDYDEY